MLTDSQDSSGIVYRVDPTPFQISGKLEFDGDNSHLILL